MAMLRRRLTSIRHGHFKSDPELLVLPPAELHSGGADVYLARTSLARVDGRAGLLELHLAVLLPHHRSLRRAHLVRDAEGHGAGGGVAVRCGLAVLAAGRPALSVPAAGRTPAHELSRAMDRSLYYVAIAFFGMINGLFNQTWLLFALIHSQILSPALLFGSVGLTLMFASLMVSTATIILAGIPAAIYERWVGAKEDSTVASLWIWLAGTALLTLPAIENFFTVRL